MKNEAMEVLLNRRSIRAYTDEQVDEERLELVLKAGTYAPTGGGAQSPLIVAVTDKATIAEFTRMNAEIMGKDMDPYYGAPIVLLVFANTQRATYVEDGSSVLTAMQYAAYAVGLGSCWIHREKQMFETPRGKELMQKWGVGEEFAGVGSLSLGFMDGPLPEPAARKEGYVIRV